MKNILITERQFKKFLNKLIKEMHDVDTTMVDQFDNWVLPNYEQLKLEYRVENELKSYKIFQSFDEFMDACENGEVIEINENEDMEIDNRSHTQSPEDLFDLISGYGSYPEFRNETTLRAIYDGFRNNKPMTMPIVVEFSNLRRRIFSGNTRMDVSFQLGINPKVLLIKKKLRN
jgi:ribosome-associated toxin RatA of RatAB toxin-antitoxin module